MINKKGFTLVELITVIVILGIVIAITLPGVNAIIKNSRTKALSSEIMLIHNAARNKIKESRNFDFSKVNKDNSKELIGIDGSHYDYLYISRNDQKISIILKKEGLTTSTNGEVPMSTTNSPFIAFEYDLSLGTGFVNIQDSDLLNSKVYVYEGSFESNKADIMNGFKNPKFVWTDLSYTTDLRTKLNKTTGIYTIVATKFKKTGGYGPPLVNYALIGVPYFDIKGLGITDLSYMFWQARNFNADISYWDTSNIKNTVYMFYNSLKFNQNINSWNMTSLVDGTGMFERAQVFNQPITSWSFGKNARLNVFFNGAKAFNQDISGWDTSNVESMSKMFYNATSFNQNISGWDVSNVVSWIDFNYGGILRSDQIPSFN